MAIKAVFLPSPFEIAVQIFKTHRRKSYSTKVKQFIQTDSHTAIPNLGNT
jgi:hypothetical protein